ncbi:hypothetical protein B0T14DRAFT_545337 [Immersiella caudata]|uniref:MACPF-like domain-containing protein n=1 Tax=Immersiella caudata TaxID=314043 RepID=A0AA39WZN4_9PEZI|nr:hypothetical protein B0T14DRAFT_545337 [Immersiella caudata]
MLEAYTTKLRMRVPDDLGQVPVYIVATKEPAASQSSLLDGTAGVFVLKFVRMDNQPSDALNVGSLHSSAFKGRDASTMRLGELRKLIGDMSSSSKSDVFCTLDSTEITQMDERDWDAVLRGCSLLYGWKVNNATNTIERATTPAFRIRPRVAETYGGDLALTLGADLGTSGDDVATEEEGTRNGRSRRPITADDVSGPKPIKLGAVPSYVVNDSSRIEVSLVESEFQESMARNHFSSSSFEASASGAFKGVSAGVSGGTSSASSSGLQQGKAAYSKQMIGKYMFPRVNVFLRPEDMEPTEELKEAIKLIRGTRNIMALRALYATFGQLFCQAVTLGGCLHTTKIVEGTQSTSMSKEKSQFKCEVGAAVSTPLFSASAKTTSETGKSSEDAKKDKKSSELMVFEATGGNTILSADPAAWSGSVADFNNWRVIDQWGVGFLVDAITQMQDYGDVKMWFLGAIPTLSNYIVIPDSRTVHARLRVSGHDDAFRRITGREQQAYLGHDPSKPVKPLRSKMDWRPVTTEAKTVTETPWGIQTDISVVTTQVQWEQREALFFPVATRAPALHFPVGKEVGTADDKRLWQTIWRFEAAHGYALTPETLVRIKSCALTRTVTIDPPPGAAGVSPSDSNTPTQRLTADLALTVYRNAQGVFLPALTSSDEPSYWRLQRLSASPDNDPSTAIRHGEPVRLTWRFSEQVSGFRDYVNDTFGRRRYDQPAECPWDALCLKIPYPRFENVQPGGSGDDAGVGLMMSWVVDEAPVISEIQVIGEGGKGTVKQSVNLHDVAFSVDVLGDDGVGDSPDYMNIPTDAGEATMTGQKRITGFHVESSSQPYPNDPASILEVVIRGGAAGGLPGTVIGGATALLPGLLSL